MAVLIAPVVDSAAGASKWHLGLINLAGPKFVVKVWGAKAVSRLDAAVTGLGITLTLRRMSSLNTGTAVVFRKTDKTMADPPSGITALSNLTTPTAESNNELSSVALNTEETQPVGSPMALWPPDGMGSEPVTLNNGDGVAVQQAGLASAGDLDVFLYFTVERKG